MRLMVGSIGMMEFAAHRSMPITMSVTRREIRDMGILSADFSREREEARAEDYEGEEFAGGGGGGGGR
jgi:hypothetical protein